MTQRTAITSLAVGLLALALSAPAQASRIQFSFTGTVIAIFSFDLQTDFSLGDAVSGEIRFESATPDSQPDSSLGSFFGAVEHAEFQFGGHTFTSPLGDITVDLRTNHVWEAFMSMATGPAFGPWSPIELILNFQDLDADIFNDDSLHTSLDLNEFEHEFAIVAFADGGNVDTVRAALTSLTVSVVPELSMSTMLLGVLAWFWASASSPPPR